MSGAMTVLRRALLGCGLLSSLLYVGADLLAAARYPEYHSFLTQAISELTAVGAPTRDSVEPLLILYDVLIIAFAIGVWISPGRDRAAPLVGSLLAAIGVAGLLAMAFAPMRMRGTGSLGTDAPHIVVTAAIVLCILLAVGIAASLFGRRFRLYSYATLATLLAFGAWAAVQGARLAAGEPTPWLGAVERIHIGLYLLWVAVLAVGLLRATTRLSSRVGERPPCTDRTRPPPPHSEPRTPPVPAPARP